MFTLVVIGLVAGLVTSISPCVLPVLPIVLSAGVSDRTVGVGPAAADRAPRRSWRPVWIVVGLVVSFCVSTLVGSVVLSSLGLPQDLLRNIGIAVLALVGLTLLVPVVGEWVEKPFARLAPRSGRAPRGNGVVLGLGLGLLYVPCAGPVLATIAVVGATHHVGWRAVVLTAAFGIGAGVPLLILALAGDALTARVTALRRRARGLRLGSGVVMIALAALIAFNLTDGLQRLVPGYTSTVQNKVESSKQAQDALSGVTAAGHRKATSRPTSPGNLGGPCTEEGQSLENCGKAPQFTGINGWLNTPGDKPLSLAGLRGKVTLVDFWTYSCINCQRTLPHVEAWYKSYEKAGFEVVGVHTPEFAFEHVRSNIVDQAKSLGVKYPIAIDNDYGTWNAYENQYWPAEYLIDAFGNIRHVAFGEGSYRTTELLIRQLLEQADPEVTLAAPTDVPTAQIDADDTSETYLGYHYSPLHTTSGVTLTKGTRVAYHFPKVLDPDGFALDGEWTQNAESLTAGPGARLELSYQAAKIYLVLSGTGTVGVTVDGKALRTIAISGVPALYTLNSGAAGIRHVITLSVSPGVQPYDFTFG